MHAYVHKIACRTGFNNISPKETNEFSQVAFNTLNIEGSVLQQKISELEIRRPAWSFSHCLLPV